MSNLKRRIRDIERKLKIKERIKIIVDWSTKPSEPEPGVTVVTWEGVEDEPTQAD